MSLILEALRKSDRQRQRAAADRLREGPRPGRPRTRTVRWLMLGSALFSLLLLAALAAFVTRPENRSQPDNSVQRDAPSPIMENSPPRPVVRGLGNELARPVEPAAESAAAAVADATSEPATQPVVVEQPQLGEFANVQQAGLPDLHVDVHAWAERPEDRFVLINLRRYQEGDRLEEGAIVRHIVADGVVLEYRGELYSLPRR